MRRAAVAACLALAGPAALAQVACDVAVTPLAFGIYDTLGTLDNRVNGDVAIDCRLLNPNAAQRISYSIAIGAGNSGSFARRTMRSLGRADLLAYNVYLNSVSPATVWGDGTGGAVAATGSITVNKNTPRRPVSLPMIGVIPARQPVGAGVYGDTLTVTITWN